MSVTQRTGVVPTALGTVAARNLAHTTKGSPRMTAITPRWLLRLLPWVEVAGGTYRANRCRVLIAGRGRIAVDLDRADRPITGRALADVDLLRSLDEPDLEALAGRFQVRTYEAGDELVRPGDDVDALLVVGRGRLEQWQPGEYEQRVSSGLLAEGDYVGETTLLGEGQHLTGVQALTPGTVLVLGSADVQQLFAERPLLGAAVRDRAELFGDVRVNEHGEQLVEVSSGHVGEYPLPVTFVDYEEHPPEFALDIVQTVLRMHTRVKDIYNVPHDQLHHQLRLATEAVRERQEWAMINDPDVGLLSQADRSCRVPARSGPPTPDDLDELLNRVWKLPAFFLAHPKAISAFGRECTRRGVPPPTVHLFGSPFLTWRGVPLVPTNKLEISSGGTTNILLLRVGEEEQGVIGLRQTGIEDEYRPGLSVTRMGVDSSAVASYLISAYFGVVALVDDALGVLEKVDVYVY